MEDAIIWKFDKISFSKLESEHSDFAVKFMKLALGFSAERTERYMKNMLHFDE